MTETTMETLCFSLCFLAVSGIADPVRLLCVKRWVDPVCTETSRMPPAPTWSRGMCAFPPVRQSVCLSVSLWILFNLCHVLFNQDSTDLLGRHRDNSNTRLNCLQISQRLTEAGGRTSLFNMFDFSVPVSLISFNFIYPP